MNGRLRKSYGLAVVSLAFVVFSCAGDLHYHAKNGDTARLQEGLNSGVPLEKRDPLGDTPLCVAAYSNKPETVDYLCKKGANVNAQNNNRVTALIFAAYYNHLDVAKVLLKYNPDKTLKDKYGNTALDYAVENKFTGMAALLKGE